jgi:poly(3-hydroxybutyrate) depolymerase
MVMFGSRNVRIWMDEAAAVAKDGPVVFYWYGTGGQPDQAKNGIDIATITAAGGLVVAPVHANLGVFPWIDGGTADYELADEVVGCAEREIGIDERHIHSHGFSAGGLFSAQFSFARSSYLASVAMYSGGGAGRAADSSNKFAALVFYGGPQDTFGGIQNFETSSKQYADQLKGAGQYVVLCNHGGMHSMPCGAGGFGTCDPAAGIASTAFFLAHGYGSMSPWGSTLPAAVPAYCQVQ